MAGEEGQEGQRQGKGVQGQVGVDRGVMIGPDTLAGLIISRLGQDSGGMKRIDVRLVIIVYGISQGVTT